MIERRHQRDPAAFGRKFYGVGVDIRNNLLYGQLLTNQVRQILGIIGHGDPFILCLRFMKVNAGLNQRDEGKFALVQLLSRIRF